MYSFLVTIELFCELKVRKPYVSHLSSRFCHMTWTPIAISLHILWPSDKKIKTMLYSLSLIKFLWFLQIWSRVETWKEVAHIVLMQVGLKMRPPLHQNVRTIHF